MVCACKERLSKTKLSHLKIKKSGKIRKIEKEKSGKLKKKKKEKRNGKIRKNYFGKKCLILQVFMMREMHFLAFYKY